MILKKNIDSDPVGPVFAAHDNKRPSSATRARTSHRRRRSPHHQRPPPPPPAPSALPQASTPSTAGARPSYCRRAPPPLPARAPPPAGVRPSSCRRPPPLLSAPAPPGAVARPPCSWLPPSLHRRCAPPLLPAPSFPAAGGRPPCCRRKQQRGGGEAVAVGDLSSCAGGAAVATDRAPVPTALRPARASQKRPGPARRRACSVEWAVQRSEQSSAVARALLKMGCTHFPPKVNSRR